MHSTPLGGIPRRPGPGNDAELTDLTLQRRNGARYLDAPFVAFPIVSVSLCGFFHLYCADFVFRYFDERIMSFRVGEDIGGTFTEMDRHEEGSGCEGISQAGGRLDLTTPGGDRDDISFVYPETNYEKAGPKSSGPAFWIAKQTQVRLDSA